MITESLPQPTVSPAKEHVFISYSSSDETFVHELALELWRNGYKVWVDRYARDFDGINAGEEWRQSIADGIQRSIAVVVVITQQTMDSTWVKLELERASHSRKTIIPLIYGDSSERNVRLWEEVKNHRLGKGTLGDRQYLNLHKDAFKEKFLELKKALVKLLPAKARAVARLRDETVRKFGTNGKNRKTKYIEKQVRSVPLPVNANEYDTREPVDNLFARLLDADYDQPFSPFQTKTLRVVASNRILLGEPGSGKTVALKMLAHRIAQSLPPRIPVFVPLSNYSGDLIELIRVGLGGASGAFKLASTAQTRKALAILDYDCRFLFDGLNEVAPQYQPILHKQICMLADEFPRHTIIATSREQDTLWRDLAQDLNDPEVYMIEQLNDAQIEKYLVSNLGAEQAKKLLDMVDNDHIRELMKRPLLLWMIQGIWEDQLNAGEQPRIPGNRGQIYRHFIRKMLVRDPSLRSASNTQIRSLVDLLTKLAKKFHAHQTISVPASAIIASIGEERLDKLKRLGMLQGDEKIQFAPHQTFQEYFAARAMLPEVLEAAQSSTPTWLRKFGIGDTGALGHAGSGWWAETFIQMAGLTDHPDTLALAIANFNPWLAWWCVQEGKQVQQKTIEAIESRSTALVESRRVEDRRRAARTLAQSENNRVRDILLKLVYDENEEIYLTALNALYTHHAKTADRGLAAMLQEDKLPVARRVQIGRKLAVMRDPRPGTGVSATTTLPEIRWCNIPGNVMMTGYLEPARSLKAGENACVEYALSAYPVTNAQYQAFMQSSDGHAYSKNWSLKGWHYREDITRLMNPKPGPANEPVVNVTWYEADAFCTWLTRRLQTDDGPLKDNQKIRLPTAAEWQKAAQRVHIDRLRRREEATAMNIKSTGIKGTCAVGMFTATTSPHGVADLYGNVWEWTSDCSADDMVTVSGGAFDTSLNELKTKSQIQISSQTYAGNIGFRLLLCTMVSG